MRNLSRASDKDFAELQLEDFELALEIVEYFMRKYQQAQGTANRISYFANRGRSGSGNAQDRMMESLFAQTPVGAAMKAKNEPPEDTTIPPEDVARMKKVVKDIKAKRTQTVNSP